MKKNRPRKIPDDAKISNLIIQPNFEKYSYDFAAIAC